MIYLASPYSDPAPAIREARYRYALQATAVLLSEGQFVYSPIVHCHELAKQHELAKDFTFWKDYNLHMLDLAEQLYVLAHGYAWQSSEGVQAELRHAKGAGKHCLLIEYDNHNKLVFAVEL